MRETREIEIGGLRYQLTTLSVKVALSAATRVAKVVGAALKDADDLKTDGGVLRAIGGALSQLEPDTLYDVARIVAEGTRVEIEPGSGKFVQVRDVFDVHFQGRLPDLAEWVYAVLEGDVFPLVRGLMQRFNGKPVASTPSA